MASLTMSPPRSWLPVAVETTLFFLASVCNTYVRERERDERERERERERVREREREREDAPQMSDSNALALFNNFS